MFLGFQWTLNPIAVSVMYVCDCRVMQIGLVPGLHVGMGDGGTGCFEAGGGLTRVTACQHCLSRAHTVFPTAKTVSPMSTTCGIAL